MYESLILWWEKDDPDLVRRLQMLGLLKDQMSTLLAENPWGDLSDPLGSLCLGTLLPSEIMFQVSKIHGRRSRSTFLCTCTFLLDN